jgi:hypothetical protein
LESVASNNNNNNSSSNNDNDNAEPRIISPSIAKADATLIAPDAPAVDVEVRKRTKAFSIAATNTTRRMIVCTN